MKILFQFPIFVKKKIVNVIKSLEKRIRKKKIILRNNVAVRSVPVTEALKFENGANAPLQQLYHCDDTGQIKK